MPLWTSPRLRWLSSQAALIVTNTNPIETTANPTTYQIAGNRSSLPFRIAPGRDATPGLDPVGSSRGRDAAHVCRGFHDRPSHDGCRPRSILPSSISASGHLQTRSDPLEFEHGEAAGGSRVEHPGDRRARGKVRLEAGAGAG